jgi:hypothetical protein
MTVHSDDDFVKSLKAKETKMRESISAKKHEITVIEKQLLSIKRAIEAFEGIKYGQNIKPKVIIPTQYSKNLTWSEKVMWSVKEIGSGFVDNITEVIAKLEPDLNKKNIKGMVTQYSSQLKKSGNLKYEKIGIKYKYFI